MGHFLKLIEDDFANVYSKQKLKKAIEKYREKRTNRKKQYKIRYRVRKELAEKRLRHKGKFIKNKKIDLQKLMNEFISEGGK